MAFEDVGGVPFVGAQAGGMGGEGGYMGILVLIILIALLGGNGLGGGSANMAEISNDFMYTNLNSTMQNQFSEVLNGITNVNSNVTNVGYQTLLGQKDISTQIAMSDCSIKQAINADGEATRALITNNAMQDLRDRLEAANVEISQRNQSDFLLSRLQPPITPAYPTVSPYVGTGGGNWCGCGI